MTLWGFLWDLLVGIIGGLVATVVWFWIFRSMRPRIQVAPEASWDPTSNWVRIKLLNASRRDLIDIQIQVDILEAETTPTDGARGARPFGTTYRRLPIKSELRPPLFLAGRRKGADDENAYRIGFRLDPRQMFDGKSDRFLRLRVFARDEVSGYGKVVEVRYTDIAAFPDGRYVKGQTFAIVPWKKSA